MRIDWTPLRDATLQDVVRETEATTGFRLPWRGKLAEDLWAQVRDEWAGRLTARIDNACPAEVALKDVTAGDVRTRWTTLSGRTNYDPREAAAAAKQSERIDWTPLRDRVLQECVRDVEASSGHRLPWKGALGEDLWRKVRDKWIERVAAFVQVNDSPPGPVTIITHRAMRTRWATLNGRTNYDPQEAAAAQAESILLRDSVEDEAAAAKAAERALLHAKFDRVIALLEELAAAWRPGK